MILNEKRPKNTKNLAFVCPVEIYCGIYARAAVLNFPQSAF